MPTGQFVFLFGYHPVGIVKFQIGDPTYVLLVVGVLNRCGKNPFFNSVELKVLGKEAAWVRGTASQ